MRKDRFLQIKRLFLAAYSLQEGESRAWLEENCRDPELRAEVAQLLADHRQDSGALETPAGELAGLCAQSFENLVGTSVGPYRIESVLGHGGMGVVFRAHQRLPDRPVALKLIRGIVDPEQLQRLELEARALATLRHPGIVPLYEQGRTEDGLPWLAMEYVEGLPLNRFVERHAVSREIRLRLFLELCDAVSHAHLKGIIHRDLKPANVLVSESPAASGSGSSGSRVGAVRVLDFGLARFSGADSALGKTLTQPGQTVGTVLYMSPEQARSEVVDQRTDVYALSVILYELVTGARPFDLSGCWVAEAIQRIVTQEPKHPAELVSNLDPDLSTMLLKGLEKEPARRYQSVAALAGDVRRFLDGLPIIAHRPSAWYQLRKLVARRRGLFAAAAALFLVLVSAGSVLAWMGAKHVADLTEERDQARAVMRFQSRLFSAEGVGGDPTVKVAGLLDAASETVHQSFADQPDLEAELRHTLGATYQALGLLKEAEPHLLEALRIASGSRQPAARESLEIRHDLGMLLLELGRLEEGEESLRQLLLEHESLPGPPSRQALGTAISHGIALRFRGRLDEAEGSLRRVLEESLIDRDQILRATGELAATLRLLGRTAEAEQMLRDSLPEMRQELGEDSPVTSQASNVLVLALRDRGALAEALTLQQELLALRSDRLGDEHPLTLTTLNNLTNLLFRLNRLDQAEAALRTLLEAKQRVLGREHQSTVTTLGNLAAVLGQTGREEEALPLHEEVVRLKQRIFGPEHYSTLTAMMNLSQVLASQGEADRGLQMLREVAETFRRTLGDEHQDTLAAYNNLGAQLQQLGRLAEAEGVLREALALCESSRGARDPETQFCKYTLAVVLRKIGRADEARLLYEELLALPEGVLTVEAGLPFFVRSGYGNCLLELDLPGQAEQPLLAAHAGLRKLFGEDSSRSRDVITLLIKMYDATGRPDRAEEYRRLLRPEPQEGDDG